jgi:hypothetical protein
LALIRRVLGQEFLALELRQLTIHEDDEAVCRVSVEANDSRGGTQTMEGRGSGPVDAVFNALLTRYAQEYQSLRSIRLVNFRVEGRMETRQAQSGVDAVGTITVEVANSEGAIFAFSDESRSIASSSARAVLAIVEYFLNAERAFITLYRSRKDAQERQRADLVSRYTQEMAEVVKSTSYAEVIESIKSELS